MRYQTTFSKPALAALIGCASKDESRVNLHHVALWEDGTAASTDGHRMMMRIVEGEPHKDRGEPMVVHGAVLRDALKSAKAKDTIEITVLDNGEAEIQVGAAMFHALDPGVSFPPLHQVSRPPEREDCPRIGLSAPLIADTCKLLDGVLKYAGSKLRPVEWQFFGEQQPVHLHADAFDQGRWLAVVMPCR